MTAKPQSGEPDSTTCGQECVVCGASHYGLHFGVLACAGCASFFRRTIVERKTYKCRNDNKCSVRADSRVACRACRYEACMGAGMSADSIRSAGPKTAVTEPSVSSAKPQETDPAPIHVQHPIPQYVHVPTDSVLTFASSNSWTVLHKYVVGTRALYNAQRSAYFLENPQYVFCDPPFSKDDVVQFMDRERKFTPTYFNIINQHFFPIAQLNAEDQKRVFRRFSNGFTEVFCYWETAKAFPITKNVFVCHYRYYMDCDDLQYYFKAMGPKAEEHHKMCAQFIGDCTKMKEKLYGQELNEMEFAALAGLWMFATLERYDLLQDEMIKQRDAVLDELHRYLVTTVGIARVGVRMGRLLLYLQSLTELMSSFSDYVVMGRIFLPDGWTSLWDLWDEHEPQLSHSVKKAFSET